MQRTATFKTFFTLLIILISSLSLAAKTELPLKTDAENKGLLTALEYLQLMQYSYKKLNYELIYLDNSQKQVDPKQLIHGVVDQQEIAYFRFMNGAMRESLQFAGKISYFEQGKPAYTLHSMHNHSVFAHIANFDFAKGLQSYEYILLGKGRIAGKQSVAIRMISKDEYHYSYVVWLDVNSYLPLRLDTLNRENKILQQTMVMSLHISDTINPWLKQLSEQQLPQLLHLHQNQQQQASNWKVGWLPEGFKVAKNIQHKLATHDNEPVSYIMLTNGLVTASVYISTRKPSLSNKRKVVQQGARLLYTYPKENIEINLIGEVPRAAAKRIIESVNRADK